MTLLVDVDDVGDRQGEKAVAHQRLERGDQLERGTDRRQVAVPQPGEADPAEIDGLDGAGVEPLREPEGSHLEPDEVDGSKAEDLERDPHQQARENHQRDPKRQHEGVVPGRHSGRQPAAEPPHQLVEPQ